MNKEMPLRVSDGAIFQDDVADECAMDKEGGD